MVILAIPPNIALAPINGKSPSGAAGYIPNKCNKIKHIRPYAAPHLRIYSEQTKKISS